MNTYVIMHHVIHGNPSTQPQVWAELDKLRAMTFKVRGEDTVRRIEAMGIDSGGHCTAAVLAYANTRRLAGVGRVFATRGQDGPIPLWPHRGSISKARGREILHYRRFLRQGADHRAPRHDAAATGIPQGRLHPLSCRA